MSSEPQAPLATASIVYIKLSRSELDEERFLQGFLGEPGLFSPFAMSFGFFFFLQEVGGDDRGVGVGRSMVGVVLGALSWAQREDESMAGWEERASSFSASEAKHI